jgi:hypothetical protein
MKILLIGEFSGVHKNLKEGLMELGHNALIAATGDGYKKIPNDVDLSSKFTGQIGKITNKISPLWSINAFKNYDIVQLINPFIFYSKLFPSKFYFNKIKQQNKKFFMLGAGDDAYFWRISREKLKYGPFQDYLKYDLKASKCYMESDNSFEFNKWLLELSDGVIPIMYEYEVGYHGSGKLLNTIPIPMNTKLIKYKENKVEGKINIFHGLNRYGFKGTRHVEEAFKYLGQKYPNELNLKIAGNMELNEYLDVMGKANIVIDQMNSYSLGVNGVYAMAMGKVVMGGSEPESLKSLGVDKSPAINLKPNADSIIEEVEKLMVNKNCINQIGHNSRQFVEKVHCHITVAQKYINSWVK